MKKKKGVCDFIGWVGGVVQLFWGSCGYFQELSYHPLFDIYGWPWKCHGTVGVSFSLFMCCNECIPRLKVWWKSTCLILYLLYLIPISLCHVSGYIITLKVCPTPFPLVSLLCYTCVNCHHAYLTYMQSTAWEMLGWMKQKLESRFPGEI